MVSLDDTACSALPLNHFGWIENIAQSGNVCIRAPAEAPCVSVPAAHGLQTPSVTPVMQKVGVAMIVVVAEPLDQVITRLCFSSILLWFQMLNWSNSL